MNPPPTENIGTPETDAFVAQYRGLGTGYYQAIQLAKQFEKKLILLQRISDAQDEALQKQIKQIIELEKIIAGLAECFAFNAKELQPYQSYLQSKGNP